MHTLSKLVPWTKTLVLLYGWMDSSAEIKVDPSSGMLQNKSHQIILIKFKVTIFESWRMGIFLAPLDDLGATCKI